MAEQPSLPFESEPEPDERSAFLDSLANTMQSTLSAARTRVAEDVERRRVDHIAAIYARRDVEASHIRELADEDRKAVDTWAAAERLRIQFDRERRTQQVEADLETDLAEHSMRIDREIARAEAAIEAHRAEIDAYFATIQRESDPVALAEHAVRRPQFPNLEAHPEPLDAETPVPGGSGADGSEEPGAVAQERLWAAPAASAPAADAVNGLARETAPTDAAAVAVMDEAAQKRARWWAMWTALPEPPGLAVVPAAVDEEEQTSVGL